MTAKLGGMQDAYVHCAQLVRTADWDRYIATLFATAEHRNALYALYAFNVEITRVREMAREPLPGEIRLQWWSEVLRGERGEEAAANPVAAALLDTANSYKFQVEPLLALVEAHLVDLYDEPIATIAELESYAVRTSSTLFAVGLRILGAHDGVDAVSRPAGIAETIAGLTFGFPQRVARSQILVPVELLARHKVLTGDVYTGKTTPPSRAVFADMCGIADANLATVRQALASLPATALPALLPLAVTALQLDRMRRRDHDPFAPRDLPRWRRQWAIWRLARNPGRIGG